MPDQHPHITTEGYTFATNILDATTISRLIEATTPPADGKGGVRNLLDITTFRALAESKPIFTLAQAVLGKGAFVVRGILFDKTGDANWKVPWHQDVTIAVTDRVEAKGYGPWSIKAGVQHVQPPASTLENMLSIRLHLDNCPAANGALRVLPGTHLTGKLPQSRIDELAAQTSPITCEAKAGDALLMRPLLLHASSASTLPTHRRVLHFDYANTELPAGLKWRERTVFSS